MTKPLEALIADANQSATIMEYIASFEPQDIEGDDVELRFELDGIDTGTDVSIVEQCGKASGVIKALIAALEQSQQEKDKWVKWASELGEKCDRLESRQLAVKLPDGFIWSADDDAQWIKRNDAVAVLHAAGITVQGGE